MVNNVRYVPLDSDDKSSNGFIVEDEGKPHMNGHHTMSSEITWDDGDISLKRPHESQPCLLSHSHSHEHHYDPTVQRRLLLVSVLCLFLMLTEMVGGIMSNSLAIATDSAHLLVDFASFIISLFSVCITRRPASSTLNFGWHRAEVMGAFVSVLLVWLATGALVYMAAVRIVSESYEVDADIMVITAGLGVIVNFIMGISLHFGGVQHNHMHFSHSHGDSHGHGHGHGHSHENINIRSALIHILGDFLQSLGVLFAALVIYFRPGWAIADPLCTFIFSIIVLCTTYPIIRDVMRVLMEGIPSNVDFHEVHMTLATVEGVIRLHSLRIWSLTTDKTALSVHLVVSESENVSKVLQLATKRLRSKWELFELTIQVEQEVPDEIESPADKVVESPQCL